MTTAFPALPVFGTRTAPHVCGHRGHSASGHENSRRALQLAAGHGATMCEIDLRLTADDKFIVFHDGILDNASSGNGWVGAYDLATLTGLTHRIRGGAVTDQNLLSFPELLEEASRLGLCLMVELKDNLTEDGHFAMLEAMIRDAGMLDRLLITSFDFPMLKMLKQRCPDLPTLGIVHSRHIDPAAEPKAASIAAYSVDYPQFDAQQAKRLHAAGIRCAHFVPRPAYFESLGEKGKTELATLAAMLRDGDIDIFGCDDVEWAVDFCHAAVG